MTGKFVMTWTEVDWPKDSWKVWVMHCFFKLFTREFSFFSVALITSNYSKLSKTIHDIIQFSKYSQKSQWTKYSHTFSWHICYFSVHTVTGSSVRVFVCFHIGELKEILSNEVNIGTYQLESVYIFPLEILCILYQKK